MTARFSATLALAVSLGGCGYVHSYVTQRDTDDATAFCDKLRSDPAIRPIDGKLPIVTPGEITPDMLAITAMPSDAELDAIKALARDQNACRQHTRAVTLAHEPTQLALSDELNMKLDLVTADLLQRKMSYGSANRLYREAALEASNKLTEQAKEEASEANEREAATLRSWAQSLVGVAKPPSPHSDKSCSWIDSSPECNGH